MKTTIKLLCLLLINTCAFAQYPISESETDATVERYFPLELEKLKGNFQDRDDVYNMSKKILTKPGDVLCEQLKRLIEDDTRNWAIVFVHNDFKHKNASDVVTGDLKKMNMTVLHKERKSWSKQREWSDYLYNTKDVILILLGQTGLDSDHLPLELGLNINNKDSFTKTSFKDLLSVIKASFLESDIQDKEVYNDKNLVPCRLIYFKKGSISPPSEIEFNVPVLTIEETVDTENSLKIEIESTNLRTIEKTNDALTANQLIPSDGSPLPGKVEFTAPTKIVSQSTDYKKINVNIHEKNYFAFSLGITGAQFDRKDFLLDTVRNIAIAALDTAKQKEWLSNLNVNVEFYPFGRDIDRLEPLLKKPFYKLHTRFGLYGGVRLNKDPLSALNAGFSFSYSRTVTLTFGWTWVDNRVADEQQVNVGENVKDIEKAKDYFNRKYERSKFSIGLTFAPSQIAKSLGIGGKD